MAVAVDEREVGERSAHALAEVEHRYSGKAGSVIPALQLMQERIGYLPREALVGLSKVLGVPAARIYGVVTFYAQFSLEPRGRHTVRFCRGTACHVKGSDAILSEVKEELGVEEGETTDDLNFTLEVIGCLGACSVSPVMMIDNDYYARLTSDRARRILGDVSSRG